MTGTTNHRVILLTPPGAGAIGVVRVVGPDAVSLVNQVFRPRGTRTFSRNDGGRLRYGRFVDGEETVDDVIVSVALASDPVTVDICAHGGIRIMERILQTLEGLGAELSETDADRGSVWPAENAVEREALEAISRAKTIRAVRFFSWQRDHLPGHLAKIASMCESDPGQARTALEQVIDGFSAARTLLDGATVVLIGPPNSGKSTLFNRLVGRSAALVSHVAGTTRDWVAQWVDLDGVPVQLVDTAGLRPSAEAIERDAAAASRNIIESADVRVVVLDGSEELSSDITSSTELSSPDAATVIAASKADLRHAWALSEIAASHSTKDVAALRVSALAETGLDQLGARILTALGMEPVASPGHALFTARQIDIGREILAVDGEDMKLTTDKLHHNLLSRA